MIKNQKGSVLLEALIGGAIAVIIVGISASSIQQINQLSQKVTTGDTANKQVTEIAEGIRTNMKNYQINYTFYTEQSAEALLSDTDLPMAWDNDEEALVLDCTNCRGRYGFVVQPYEKYRGLYMVTLKVTHKDWLSPRMHKFVVSAK